MMKLILKIVQFSFKKTHYISLQDIPIKRNIKELALKLRIYIHILKNFPRFIDGLNQKLSPKFSTSTLKQCFTLVRFTLYDK